MSRATLVVLLLVGACGGGDAEPADAAPLDAAICTPAPDAQPATSCVPDAGACDYFLHCGCGATSKCTVGDTASVCGGAGGKAPGEICAADADCARGGFCSSFAGATTCLAFCDDAHRCPSGQECYVTVNDRTGRAAGRVCGPVCSLLGGSCGAAALGCYPSALRCTDGDGLCLIAGTGDLGSSCSRANDCKSGSVCVEPSGSSHPICAKICDRKGSEPMCGAGICRELPGQTQTGVCLP